MKLKDSPFIKFLYKLINSNDPADSKVFVGLSAFAYVIITGFIDLFTHHKPTDFVFFGILGLVIAVFGLTTYSFIKTQMDKIDKPVDKPKD